MAVIPGGQQFGNLLPRPQGAAPIPRGAFGEGVAQVVGHMADVELQRQQQEEARAAHERQQMQQAADKAEALRVLHEGRAQMTLAADEFAARIASGEVPRDEAETEWASMADNMRQQWGERAPAVLRGDVDAGLKVEGLQHLRTVRGGVRKREQEDARAGLTLTLEQAERLAVNDREGAITMASKVIAELGPAAGYGPDDQAKLAAKTREAFAANALRARLNGARDDPAALQQVLEAVRADGELSPERALQLEQQAQARIEAVAIRRERAQARAEAMAERRERQADRALMGLQSFLDQGGMPDDAYVRQLTQQVSGTSAAPVLTSLLQGASERAGFALLTPAQQEARLLQMRQEAARSGNPAMLKKIETLDGIRSRSRKALDDDPLAWGAARGYVTAEPLQFASLDQLAGALKDRDEAAQVVTARTGVAASPLFAHEAQRAGELLAALPLPARRDAVRMLAARLSPDSMRGLAAQIGKGADNLGLTLYAAATLPPEVPELMLRGDDAVKAKRIKSASEDGSAGNDHREIAKRLDAVPWPTPQARDAAVKAAQLLYDGQRDAKGSGSVRDAIEKTTGGLTEWAGAMVPITPGMDARSFKRAVERIDPAALARDAGGAEVLLGGTVLPIDKLAANMGTVQLIPAGGPGVYALRSGGLLVQRRDGRPLVIRVNGRN